MKEELNQLINNIELRPNAYLFNPNDYFSLVNFVGGYGIGARSDEGDVIDSFQVWLQQKYNSHFSVHWSFYILNELCLGDQDQAKIKLIDLLKEYSFD